MNPTYRRYLVAAAIVIMAYAATSLFSAGRANAAVPPPAPYGGCAEAWQAPQSEGVADCRTLGYVVKAKLVVDPNGVVLYSTLPSCKYEDASSGPLPCSWNLHSTDGDGKGLAFYVTGHGKHLRFHYVWHRWPDVKGWEWITASDSRAMGGGRNWEQCLVRFGHLRTDVKCADGFRYQDRT